MVTIDGTDISAATIDGNGVQEITMDGDVVWTGSISYPSGLIAQFKFEENSDDETGNYSFSGNIDYSTDSVVGSHSGDFSTNYLSHSGTPLVEYIDSGFTITTWVNGVDGDGDYVYEEADFSDFDRHAAFGPRDDDIKYENRNSGGGFSQFTPDGDATTGNWHFICAAWDGSNVHIYLDGNKLGSDSISTNIGNPNEARIGDRWDGLADDLCLFDRQLSDSEVENFYNEY